tara:strand:+ start:2614 stop:2757 length:144 start_codon:yes stop_codon:yes gene_type:complete
MKTREEVMAILAKYYKDQGVLEGMKKRADELRAKLDANSAKAREDIN